MILASIDLMREYVSRQYNGTWPEKVRRMPDYQVTAIYYSMKKKLEETQRQPRNPMIMETEVRGGRQLSFFEGTRNTRIKEEYLNG